MDQRCFFLSDLHLLSRRSSARLMTNQIHSAVRRADTLVLGGDIFDFKWSTLSSFHASLAASLSWMEQLLEVNPNCQVHYVLGNHDAEPRFVAALDRLADACSGQLVWHPYYLRIQNRVFLHGDILDGPICHQALDARRRIHGGRVASRRMSHALYDAAVSARLHRVAIHVVQRRRRVLRKLSHYLQTQQLGPDQGVQHVYFGHIHRPIHGVEFRGLTFHNGGASIKGLKFRIVDATAVPSSN